MNDEFLKQFYETPRAGFAKALYERISHDPPQRIAQPVINQLTFRNVVVAFSLLFFIAACVYAIAERGWRRVGNFWINVERTQKVSIPPMPDIEELEAEPQSYGCVPLDEAKEALPFDLHVPTWAPDGFIFDGRVCGVNWIGDSASLYWQSEQEQFSIQLLAAKLTSYNWHTQDYKTNDPIVGTVGPGSYKEVEVQGQPAILVRGEWDWMKVIPTDQEIEFDSKWDSELAIRLYWLDGDILYYLYTRADVSAEDLIKMAESAQ